MNELLSADHTIVEKGMMEFQPFGTTPQGEKIRDISGVSVRANLEYLEELVARNHGQAAGHRAVQEAVRLLNERIPDATYHVTEEFLRNQWNSYSYEFLMFLTRFCDVLSGDPEFQFKLGQEKFISPIIQTLARPFSVGQAYKMFAYFGEKFAKGSIIFEAVEVRRNKAVLRIKFTDRAYRQFGAYRKSCARHVCQAAKAATSAIPSKVHGLRPAVVRDRTCIVNGDEYCEWEFTWDAQRTGSFLWTIIAALVTAGVLAILRVRHPSMPWPDSVLLALFPGLAVWWAFSARMLRKELEGREEVIQEQLQAVESRHEELRDAYLEQEQTTAELRRKVAHLTALHQTGLLFSSTLDRDSLLENVLEAIVKELHYHRAMISFYDSSTGLAQRARIMGVSKEMADFAYKARVPVTDENSLEGMVLLKGIPILVTDIGEVWDRLHPLNQQLVALTETKCLVSVPLKAKDRILGSLTVTRAQEQGLTADDLELMITVGNQVAIALDNADAYRQIEHLNIGLEEKVRERTLELEAANDQLKEMDRLKSKFLAHVSHELRTPLTSIQGFVENLLAQTYGALTDKQKQSLGRIHDNVGRLGRMISDLLDRSRLEAHKMEMELRLNAVSLGRVVADVVEQMQRQASDKKQNLECTCQDPELVVWADSDRLVQVLTNLVDNAIKYTPEGGHISVHATQEGHFAKVSVTDTGDGVAPDVLPKLFDPFYRATHQKKTHAKGLGLGLSIVKGLIDLHGGRLTVRSELGRGSEFTFTVPMAVQNIKPHASPAASGRRILVVDDDPDIRQLLMDRLSGYGYRVETAADGRQALRRLEQASYDGIILDISMPELDGLEVLQQLRKSCPRLPVVMVTASGLKERAVQALAMGAQDYVLKPFDAPHLKEVIDRWF
jgi:signal transduction histidine kinase